MLRFVAVILGAYGVYSFIAGYQYSNWSYLIGGVLCLVGAVSLWLKKRWSQYFVYIVAVLFCGSWLFALWQVAERGWPYNSLSQTVIALIPGLLMVGIAIGSCVVVYRAFKRER